MNVYRITYDIRLGRKWLAGNDNGWSSMNVLANGDARKAIAKSERLARREWSGEKITGFRVLRVERIASDVVS